MRPLLSMRVDVDEILQIGDSRGGARRVANIRGGTFEGERLAGFILPGGSDWQIVESDGAVLLDARLVLRCHDGALVAMTYTGIRHGPADVMSSLGRGEPVDPSLYYFRIVPSFSTAAPRHQWLNRIVAVGRGERLPGGPVYDLHELL